MQPLIKKSNVFRLNSAKACPLSETSFSILEKIFCLTNLSKSLYVMCAATIRSLPTRPYWHFLTRNILVAHRRIWFHSQFLKSYLIFHRRPVSQLAWVWIVRFITKSASSLSPLMLKYWAIFYHNVMFHDPCTHVRSQWADTRTKCWQQLLGRVDMQH